MARGLVVAVVTFAAFVMGATPASAAALTVSGGTITYTGVDTAETVHIESLSATSVKFFFMEVGQVVAPLPTGCAFDTTRKTDQIVTCTINPLDGIVVLAKGGKDVVDETGLSKPSTISGGDGDDSIVGGSQADAINGDAGADTINAGAGDDTVNAQDGLVDTINCGLGTDVANADNIDKLTGCERPTLAVVDQDGDGYSPPEDCNDNRADIHPGAYDVPGDGIDQDCDGKDAAVPSGSGSAGGGSAGGGPTGTGSTGAGAATPTPTPTPAVGDATTSGAAASGSTGTGAGSGVANNNPVVDGASTAAGNASTGTFGVATTSGTKGITITNTSTTAAGTPVAQALIIAANPSITFHLFRGKRRYTRATKITVAPVPAGATVSVTCKGAGCPAKGYKKTFAQGLDHLIVRSLFDLAKLRRGAKLRIQVTKPGVIGRAVRYTVNTLTAPDAEASCLAAGTATRTTC